MKKFFKGGIVFSSLVAVSSVLVGSTAVSSGQTGALVRLQSTTPGVQQAGHVNVNGTVIANRMSLGGLSDSTFAITGQAQAGLWVRADPLNAIVAEATTPGANYPAVVAFVTPGSAANNTALWAQQQVTGSNVYLAHGESGIVASSGFAGTGFAGRFNGRVLTTGALAVGTAHDPDFMMTTAGPAGLYVEATQYNGIVAGTASAGNYPAIAGFVRSGSVASNIAVWGRNEITSSNAYLARGQDGVVASAGAGGTGYAGIFNGRVHVTGNVGVGVLNPAYPISFPDTLGDKISLWGQGSNHYGFGVQSGLLQIYSDAAGADVAFGYGSSSAFTETMRVKGSGNVGIGTTTPSSRLHVSGATTTPILYANNTTTTSYAIHALLGSSAPSYPFTDRSAVRGDAIGSGNRDGVLGVSDTGLGVFGYSALGGIGVFGRADNATGRAVYGFNSAGGSSGYFFGNATVTGTLSKGAGTFKIDHPLDPEGKYLYHSFVESPDMMNIYNGEVRTDERGFATVTLPSYFEALNRDFRYQLTVVDDGNSEDFVLAKVVQRIKGNTFVIRTSEPNVAVCWEVTGVRQDAYANAHRVKPEVEKEPENQGLYIHPKEHGHSEERGIDFQDLRRRGINQPARVSK